MSKDKNLYFFRFLLYNKEPLVVGEKMNKKVNIILNIFEFLLFFLFLACVGLFLAHKDLKITIPTNIDYVILLIGLIASFFYISIELFLFLILKKLSKYILILYFIIEIITSIYINSKISFSALIVVIVFHIIKSISRIILVNKIYIAKEYEYYSQMFGTKVKKQQEKARKNYQKEKKLAVNRKQKNIVA